MLLFFLLSLNLFSYLSFFQNLPEYTTDDGRTKRGIRDTRSLDV